MTPATTAGTAESTARAIGETFDAVCALVLGWRDALAQSFADGPPTADGVDAFVSGLVRDVLRDPEALLTGAGFVAAPDYLPDAPWHLSWWLRAEDGIGGLRCLPPVAGPESEDFRDYTALEWWRLAVALGGPHLTGPYVDYVCTDDYTLTITTPVVVRDAVVGVAGADLYVARLERLLPMLRPLGRCTLVNASARVVLSTDARRPTGTLLRLPELPRALAPLRERPLSPVPAGPPTELPRDADGSGASVFPCGGTSLALVVEP